ncbi:MAG: alpha/beta fold hydrolase, partial [Candidatus Hodarchaeales archaeon]
EYFRTKGFGVLALSLPGHGKSYHSPSKSIFDYAKEVYSLISQLNLRNFVLIGHSMGGGICLSYVLTYSNHPPTRYFSKKRTRDINSRSEGMPTI